MELIIAAIVVVFLLIMGFKAYQGYPAYKGSIYQQLFSSYLEYFWKYAVKEDLSRSQYLEGRIGPHRITYNAYSDAQGKRVGTFVTVFSTRGHASMCTVHTSGAVTGGDTGPWSVGRAGKRYALPSPVTYLKRQKRFLDTFLKGKPVEYIVAVGDDVDIEGVSCSYTVLHVGDVVDHLAEKPEGAASEADMLQAFESFKEMAHHAQ